MENTKNSFIDIDAYYEKTAAQEGWAKEDFAKVILGLESMNREQLVSLCKQSNIGVSFVSNNWEEIAPKEQMILALIADCKPQTLIDAIEKV